MRFLVLLLYLLLCPLLGKSQELSGHVFGNTFFQNYSMKNGLTSNYCYDVLQDTEGYIWVATLNGLSRFSGNGWTPFQQQSMARKHVLPSNWVMDIDEEPGKGLWMNTDRGIAFYDTRLDSVIIFPEPVKGWGKILYAGSGQLLVSSWTGVDQLEQRRSTLASVKHYTGTENNSFPMIWKDQAGVAWCCPEDKPSLIQVDPVRRQLSYRSKIQIRGKGQTVVVNAVCQLSSDTLLLATRHHGVLKYSASSNHADFFLPDRLDSLKEYSAVAVYRWGSRRYVFVGTKHAGLYVADESGARVYHHEHVHDDPGSLSGSQVTAIYPDRQSGVWIATATGLSYFHPSLQKSRSYHFYDHPVIPASVMINAVCRLAPGRFLIGTDANGLFTYDHENRSAEAVNIPGSPEGSISSICRTSRNIWIGTKNGLYEYDVNTNRCRAFQTGGKYLTEQVLRVRLFNGGILAVCCQSGLLLLDAENQKVIWDERRVSSSGMSKRFCKDALYVNGKIWVLRFFDGWEVYDLKSRTCLYKTPQAMQKFPLDYHNITASPNHIYISSTAGIYQQQIDEPWNVRLLKTTEGLVGDWIVNVLAKGDSDLVYTNPDGLYTYNINRQVSTRLGVYENYIQKWFNQLDTIPGGYLYTVSNYVVEYLSETGIHNTLTPSLRIRELLVNHLPWDHTGNRLVLEHDRNNLTFRLSSLVYPAADKNYWVYHLNKLDTIPHTSRDGIIELKNLPPDNYTLSIESYNDEGLRSTHTAVISILIKQPFYSTIWFFILILLFAFGLGFSLFWYRRRQEARLSAIRSQISRDLHDELGANVSSINIMANMLLNRHGDTHDPVIRNISRYSVEISDTINDIIWNVNPKFDSVSELVRRMTRYASETIEPSGISYHIAQPSLTQHHALDNKVKYHLYLIFKEMINNAVRHANASHIDVTISATHNSFSICISDNGVGFDDLDTKEGNGLINIKSRSAEIGARLVIKSVKNEGTQLTVNIILS